MAMLAEAAARAYVGDRAARRNGDFADVLVDAPARSIEALMNYAVDTAQKPVNERRPGR